MKIAYIDAFSGVAGDMLLAALVDAGASLEELVVGLRTILPLSDEWDLNVRRVTRGEGSIAAAHVIVTSKYQHHPVAPPSSTGHLHGDHDHDHSGSHTHDHSHARGDAHNHSHDHSLDHELSNTGDEPDTSSSTFRHDPVRNLRTISQMLRASGLPTTVRERSIEVFSTLGEAEAKTHDSTIDKVHFHEVGAIDSIIDTVGVVYALHLLGVDKVFCSPLPYSEGSVWTAHGNLPVPAPATLRLMMGLPTCPGPNSAMGELVTPTGAALVRVLSSEFGRPPSFTPQAVGIGAGTKDFEKHPNILRVVVGDVSEPPKPIQPMPLDVISNGSETVVESGVSKRLCVLEANFDDMTGEVAGHLTDKLLATGSLDAWVSPVFMKKGRPAYTLHVLCEPEHQNRLMNLLFVESTTLGVRRYYVERCSLNRKMITSFTEFGDVRVKVAWLNGVLVNSKPEYEDCKELADAAGVPIQAVMDAARAAQKTQE